MANPNAIFGVISNIDRERGITFSDQQTVRLDPANVRSSALSAVLETRSRRGMPVYVELDPATRFVTRVRIPNIVRVETITENPATGEVSVTFERSHARHVIKRGAPDAGELLSALRNAGKDRWLAVTSNDAQEIIDVRPFDPPFELPRKEPPPPLRWWRWPWWPWNWFRCVSINRAQQLFDLCAVRTCNPTTVPPPCIPFLFPDDGCWGRAHEMARLMIEDGAHPRKVWIYGNLHTLTKNNPNCYVDWGWHVAPTLCVRKKWWWWFWFRSEEMVIDPSLFTTPVTKSTWKGVQGDPSATFVSTSSDVFSRWAGDQPDPGYVQTNIVLADYRDALQTRSLGPNGPPPYAGC